MKPCSLEGDAPPVTEAHPRHENVPNDRPGYNAARAERLERRRGLNEVVAGILELKRAA